MTRGIQAGLVVTRFDGDNTTPTLLILVIQNGDHDLTSGGDIDLRPCEFVGIMVTEVNESIAAWVIRRNEYDIVGAIGLSPGEVRGLALGELDSSDIEVSPGMGGKESENEGSGEKSGVHRRDTLETLKRTRGRDETFWTRARYVLRRWKTEEGLPSNSPTSILGRAAIRVLTVTGLFGNSIKLHDPGSLPT